MALLQLFFADLEPTTATLAIAEEQLALHREQLAAYMADQLLEERGGPTSGMTRSLEHWRGVTLKMGLLYERAAVEFWEGVVRSVSATDAAAAHARAEDDGATVAPAHAGVNGTLDG